MNRQYITVDGTVVSNAEVDKLEQNKANKMDVFSQVVNKEKEQLAEPETSDQEPAEKITDSTAKGVTEQQENEQAPEESKKEDSSEEDDFTNKDILNALEKLLKETKDSNDKKE